jgi:hypothetical protein
MVHPLPNPLSPLTVASANFHIVLSFSVFIFISFSVYSILFSLYIMICDFSQEFVACQDDRDPGVLILSPFAGAGGLMQEALQVRPPSQLVGTYVVLITSRKSKFMQ